MRVQEPLNVTEIGRRAEQGLTRPFQCVCDDGNQYWVKSVTSCGAQGLIKEWVAGCMGKAFKLPIPAFCMVNVPDLLIQYSANEEVQELGSGIAFASRHVEHANDLLYKDVAQVEKEARRRVLVFDAWTRNGDRVLGRKGGNVNLLWKPAGKSLRVFDHNNAFDDDFRWGDFLNEHVFRGDLAKKDNDFAVAIEREMKDICAAFRTFTDPLPDEWLDRVEGLPDFSIEWMESIVSEYRKAADLLRDSS